MRALAVTALMALLALVVPGCGGGAEEPAPDAPSSITVKSTAFGEGGEIPREYTCDGANTSPALSWSGIPDDARALALVVDDPDAPRGAYVHWVVLDIPKSVSSVDRGAVPQDGVQAENSAGDASWTGPCPPSGRHRYRFTVYALRDPTGLPAGTSLREALDVVDASTVARGRLTGTYAR